MLLDFSMYQAPNSKESRILHLDSSPCNGVWVIMMAENRNKPSQSSHHCNIPRFMYGLPSLPLPGHIPPPLVFMTCFLCWQKALEGEFWAMKYCVVKERDPFFSMETSCTPSYNRVVCHPLIFETRMCLGKGEKFSETSLCNRSSSMKVSGNDVMKAPKKME